MFAILGIVVVFGAVIGGYLLEHGNLHVLFQPAELVIIGGAALGTLFIANPLKTILALLKGLTGVLGGSKFNKAFYLETLKLLNDLFLSARKNGLAKLEADVEEPEKSQVFSKYPKFLKDHHAVHFVCDTLRMSITGGVGNFELDQMMEADIEVHHHEASEPVSALTAVADSLPGLGIVAAVLGVVITMGAIGGRPGGHVSRHSALLWPVWSPRVEHEQTQRSGVAILPGAAAGVDFLCKGLCAHSRLGVRPALDSPSCAAHV
jgi:chemotaxis protein MotA